MSAVNCCRSFLSNHSISIPQTLTAYRKADYPIG
ncbi:hypothetical protein PHMEG_00024534 [Phytophthora megakarya]|uniref:Uncharacterized protein n=1 Tax=Phytophthora megakarya TaxID=4795 RepID=A0A225VE93_9STRA|nr:hypothetical protein PHMEG_00024534 [Phytophthora megakarya]